MRVLALLVLALAACARPATVDCHGRNAECGDGQYCSAHACLPASTAPYAAPLTFLLTAPDGSGFSEDRPVAAFTAVADTGGARRLVACPPTQVTIDAAQAGTLAGVGVPALGLPVRSHVTSDFGDVHRDTLLSLAPGTWSFLLDWQTSPPSTVSMHLPGCLETADLSLAAPTGRRLAPVHVSLFVDRDRDRRPFCDARLDIVDEQGGPQADPVILAPGCSADHVLNTLEPDHPYFVRVQPGDPGNASIATQLVPLSLEPMELSAVGAPGPPRTVRIQVRNASDDPLEPVRLRAEGTVADGERPWPAQERPAVYVSELATPVADARGTYTMELIPGCYHLRAEPPESSLSGATDGEPKSSSTFCPAGTYQVPDPAGEALIVQLKDRVTLRGTVLASGTGVSGTRVTALPVLGRGREAFTYAADDGTFLLRVDPDTTYDLLVQPPADRGLPWDRVPLASNQSSRLVILPDPVVVAGSVSYPDGRPLPRALVQAWVRPFAADPRPAAEAVSDADGNFTMVLPDPAQAGR
jgi:hypothetical protein